MTSLAFGRKVDLVGKWYRAATGSAVGQLWKAPFPWECNKSSLQPVGWEARDLNELSGAH